MPALDGRLDQQVGKICNAEGIVNSIVLLGPIGPIFNTFACGFLMFPKSLLMLVNVSSFWNNKMLFYFERAWKVMFSII